MKKIFTYLAFFIGVLGIFAQNIPEKGVPFIQNYLPEQYGNHGKIWDISSAKNGLVYMASDNGLLEFDGQTWNRYRDNKGFTRSLFVENDSTIYIGADMDFGIWKKNRLGKFNFTSLYPYKKHPLKTNEEFWNTYKIGGKIIFISHQNIYVYQNKKLIKIASPQRFSKSFSVEGKIYITDEKYGLFQFDGEKLIKIFSYPSNNLFKISGLYKKQGDLYIVTENQGILLWKNNRLSSVELPVSTSIIKGKVFIFNILEDRFLVFGTILNGLFITDLNGNILQKFNKNNGLPNNTVLSVFFSKNQKLWIGLDYGISSVNLNSRIAYFQDNKNDFGTSYAVVLKDQTFYLGTNQGLYKSDWNALNTEQNSLELIKGSEGQVWTLQNIDGHLWCGHDKGLFKVEANSFTKIHDEPGVFCIKSYQNYLLTGNYNGISIFKKENNSWRFFKKMELILGAVSQIEIYQKYIFINIPNYGVIKFSLDQDLKPLNRQLIDVKAFKGYFPSIFKDQKGIHVITKTHQYFYDEQKKQFLLENKVNEPNINKILPGIYKPTLLNSNYGFYPIENGFALENYNRQNNSKDFKTPILFRKVRAFNNEKTVDIFSGEKIPYQLNNIGFTFLVSNEDYTLYRYKLDNFSENWSGWSGKNTAAFLNLKEGTYKILVQSKRENQVSGIQSFEFTISAPWYRRWWAYVAYLLFAFSCIYFVKKYQEYKLRKQKLELLKKEQNSLREQTEKHQQEMVLEKQKLLEVEKNNLKLEIRNKTIELANKAKDDDDKNRLLHTLKEKIDEVETNPSISQIRWKEIRRLLNSYLEIEDNTFEIQMDELHQEFFKSLKEKFPNLSIYDLRMCAYLKIGLNSKEMSEIFQVLPSSINVSRSRLRKKLNLFPDDDLYEFLNRFG